MNSQAVNDALEAAAVALRDLAVRNRDLMTRCSYYENTVRMVLKNLVDADARRVLTNLLEKNGAIAEPTPVDHEGFLTEGE